MPNNLIVYDSYIAKQMLNAGHIMVDIAKNKNSKQDRLVFYFQRTEKAEDDLEKFIELKKSNV
ncbi:hypothetical protein [Thermobrachium celere]|uniref:hypothetical protein n=1 Tax=Thermobrachium celere TaxID=53422 RepID=UPI0019407DB8|nr:hypothetical protein [Thermobrachium celere]GFR35356.1 hypothetical protein TCEA9_11680 [Thermobrachium celere]